MICKQCHIDKPVKEFGIHKQGKYRIRKKICKKCENENAAAYNRKNYPKGFIYNAF